jgi:hypothetical protein
MRSECAPGGNKLGFGFVQFHDSNVRMVIEVSKLFESKVGRHKGQGTRHKAQGTRYKAQGTRDKGQGTRHKVQGTR